MLYGEINKATCLPSLSHSFLLVPLFSNEKNTKEARTDT